jgi:ABC transporter DrrB family efflux protein
MTTTITAPTAAPSAASASIEVARRALRRYFRTPAVFVIAIVQSALFLFCFRYVFGGAVHTDAASYAAFLVPGYAATIVLFNGSAIAVAITEDRAEGFTDRLLSLPIPRRAIVIGRGIADATTNAWAITTTLVFGFLFGFRLHGSLTHGLMALGLCLLYGVAFTFVFTVIGLISPNAQAAQGMSMIAFVLAFFSNTYVPVDSMPGWLQSFAAHQPVTPMVEAVRSTLAGGTQDVGLAIAWSAVLIAVFLPIAVVRYRHA